MAKQKKGKVVQMLSPENYIRKKARTLPIYECWVNENWEESKTASVTIARKHTNEHVTLGFYLVDLLCLGVKDTSFRFNIAEEEYRNFIGTSDNRMGLLKINYALAHNIIFAGLEFANDYGFKPHKDFESTMQYFLEEDSDDIELMEIECGNNDQPMFVRGPFDNKTMVTRTLAQLEKTAGPGNYTFIDNLDDDELDDDILDDDFLDESDPDEMPVYDDNDRINSQTFQFKVQIEKITNPPVWRKVTVPSYYTFYDFHMVIQIAFGWEDYHLFQFSPKGFGSKPLITANYDEEDFGYDSHIEASEIRLYDVFSTEKQTFNYIYDFGDSWSHKITLEKIVPEVTIMPYCIDGKGKCPPEDCGGIWSYENLKEILTDKKHPEFKAFADWLGMGKGEIWDSNAFNLSETQKILSQCFSE